MKILGNTSVGPFSAWAGPRRAGAGGLILSLAVVGALLLSGCDRTVTIGGRGPGPFVSGSGKAVTKDMNISDFTKVDASNNFKVQITRGSSYKVTVTTDDNIVDHLDVRKDGQTLVLALQSGSYSNITLQANVTMPDLQGLRLSGATNGTVEGFNSQSSVDIGVSGASRLSFNSQFGDVKITNSGASHVTGTGAGNGLNLDVSGASTADLQGFAVKDATVGLSGASNATVDVTGTLNANLSGASTLRYTGSPTLGNVDVTGASSLKKL
ncbi:MAG: head GIN domain-containing protein [Chloroflexota bacterium]